MQQTAVAIVGAGPVGLTAAALLRARDIDVVVLEKNSSTSDEPKAISLDDESLRAYQWADLISEVLAIVVPGTGTRYYDSDGRLALHARAAVPARLGYPFKNPFAQPDLERAMLRAVSELGASVRFDSEVVHVDQRVDGVRLTVSGPRGDTVLNAQYVLGCDGGSSAVRLLQGITMTGRSYDDVWLVVDTLEDHHTERYAMHYGTPNRPHVIVPGLHGRCRYEFRLREGEGRAGETPGLDLIKELLAPYRSITQEQVERAVSYRFNAVVADEWVYGRTFLLGDAAHMMPPFAGQGLNSGIRDAANLCWKLSDVLDGRLDPAILLTYETERRPHAEAVVRSSERLGRVVMTTSQRLARARDRMIGAALATDEGRAYFEEMRYRPVQHHRTGLVVPGDRPDLVGLAIGQPRVFDMTVHEIRPLDDALGNGWAVLGVDVPSDAWAAIALMAKRLAAHCCSVPLDETVNPVDADVLIDFDGRLIEEVAAFQGRFVLIRPDRIVAATWLPRDSAVVATVTQAWLADQSELTGHTEKVEPIR